MLKYVTVLGVTIPTVCEAAPECPASIDAHQVKIYCQGEVCGF